MSKYKNSKIQELAEKFKSYSNTPLENALKGEDKNSTVKASMTNSNKKNDALNKIVDTLKNGIKMMETNNNINRPKSNVKYFWDKENHEIILTFGKNGHGLTDEFIIIGEFIKRLSEKARVYIENAFIDACDDVYDIKLKYYYF